MAAGEWLCKEDVQNAAFLMELGFQAIYCRGHMSWHSGKCASHTHPAFAPTAPYPLLNPSLACYAAQDLVTSLHPAAADWLAWAGLRLGDTASGGEVERALRGKALLLVAVALKQRTFRWAGWRVFLGPTLVWLCAMKHCVSNF